ncbi:MAG: hypothetical protein ACR2F0_09410, partial [Chthoniobacterales bacterium]
MASGSEAALWKATETVAASAPQSSTDFPRLLSGEHLLRKQQRKILKLKTKNIVGGRVRQIRWARGLRQRDLAARLQIIGWDAGRVTMSKIESRL